MKKVVERRTAGEPVPASGPQMETGHITPLSACAAIELKARPRLKIETVYSIGSPLEPSNRDGLPSTEVSLLPMIAHFSGITHSQDPTSACLLGGGGASLLPRTSCALLTSKELAPPPKLHIAATEAPSPAPLWKPQKRAVPGVSFGGCTPSIPRPYASTWP